MCNVFICSFDAVVISKWVVRVGEAVMQKHRLSLSGIYTLACL